MAKPGKNEMMPGAATPKHVRLNEGLGAGAEEARLKAPTVLIGAALLAEKTSACVTKHAPEKR